MHFPLQTVNKFGAGWDSGEIDRQDTCSSLKFKRDALSVCACVINSECNERIILLLRFADGREPKMQLGASPFVAEDAGFRVGGWRWHPRANVDILIASKVHECDCCCHPVLIRQPSLGEWTFSEQVARPKE